MKNKQKHKFLLMDEMRQFMLEIILGFIISTELSILAIITRGL